MKKYLAGAVVGAVITFSGLTWNGQETINQVQGQVDRLSGMVISLVEQLNNNNDTKGTPYDSPNDNTLWGEIRRLEEQLSRANQAVETLGTNSSNQYNAARTRYESLTN